MTVRDLMSAALLVLLACGAPSRETYEVTGVVEAVDADQGQIKIAHEEIPGFMPAMTMNFDVVPKTLLAGIEPGLKVHFTLEREATRLRITAIRSLGGEPAAGVGGGFGGLAEREPAPEFRLIDQDGRPVALGDLRGKAVVLDFVFTRCDGPCPILTSARVTLQRRLPESLVPQTHFVSISIDPESDTPARLRRYATDRGADLRSWSFLTGDPARVKETLRDYWVGWRPDGDGDIDHLVVTYLIDPEGQIARRYLGLEHPPEEILQDLEEVLS